MHAARCSLYMAVCALLLFGAPRLAGAQQTEAKLRQQRAELDRIRAERAALERRMLELQGTVHDLSEEVANLNARREATERLVATLDRQLAAINGDVVQATRNMARAEDELDAQRATLRRRLVDIYKRGPMYTTEALLSAQSFGELVARYKYLHLLALHDRALVRHVQDLRDQVAREHTRLIALQDALKENRNDKRVEEENLRYLERERAASLASAQRSARTAEVKLERLRRTEGQITSTIAAFEAARRRAESARPSSARRGSSISTSDYGRLDWPVEGPLVYTYGKAQTATNTTIRWNGVGIRASVGTPVRAIAAGRVVSVGQLGTYGLTVIIEHGGGDYSIYGSLGRASVEMQQSVAKGEIIGTVGISDPDLPPHLHFEIRHGGPAVDPADWLRGAR
ncbi:MAG TPA: peptidoglycan DD-metalloendopeptidase family protein [Gemmatimonadaceae bacterium]|nr:peptidoglycan DD-metalloendopeptidase family protein [Gemmatimonadaceae bacterium]